MKALLHFSTLYRGFTHFVTASGRSTRLFVSSHIRVNENDRVLDIACGPGYLRSFLPDNIFYTGFDISENYIRSAQQKYPSGGTFFVAAISANLVDKFEKCDVVIASGVLHHLNDEEAAHLFAIARSALKPDGRLVTADGCFREGQSWLARKIVGMDRGKYVREANHYPLMARSYFSEVKSTIYDGLLRIPYTHLIMECRL